jgi:hypothetical protein
VKERRFAECAGWPRQFFTALPKKIYFPVNRSGGSTAAERRPRLDPKLLARPAVAICDHQPRLFRINGVENRQAKAAILIMSAEDPHHRRMRTGAKRQPFLMLRSMAIPQPDRIAWLRAACAGAQGVNTQFVYPELETEHIPIENLIVILPAATNFQMRTRKDFRWRRLRSNT